MSRIYQQNRALGYVSNLIPATVRFVNGRKENCVSTCVGKSFQTLSCSHFRLLAVSGLHPEEITCLASDKFLIYSAAGKVIYGWRRGNEIKYKYVGHSQKVHLLLPFGEHLLSVDEGSLLKVWDKRSECVYLEIPFDNSSFKISTICHPNTYINKVLVGSEQGGLQLWNIRHGKLIYTFKGFDSKITVLEQAPAIDVAAVGMQSGKIVLLNLKVDTVLMEFTQEWGCVTGITFRTDGPPMMATSTNANGQIALWNLEEKKVVGTLNGHHEGIFTLKFLPNEPLLLTTSSDNSLKLWIFDKLDGSPRLLRYRDGHSGSPLHIRYHGSKGDSIISSGEDSSMRIFSTISDTLNVSLGRASYNRKVSKKTNNLEEDHLLMPPITEFTSETTREKHWDSIVALHSGLVTATSWSFDKRKMGELKLVPDKFQEKNRTDFRTVATTLNMTQCGNFVIIGYSNGDIERFNIQSGLHRGSYGNPAHGGEIRGLWTDNLNQLVISGGTDACVKFWPFKGTTEKTFGRIKLPESINLFRGHRESSMLCVALEDFSVYIIDYETKIIVRKFLGHSGPITDACFSPDSRWLITSSMDCTIKTWDIPSSYLIDHFKLSQPCISMTMSPTGDFLATAHVDFLGVYLWANKTLYEHISLRAVDPESEPRIMELPNMTLFEHKDDISSLLSEVKIEDEDDEDGELIKNNYKTPKQIDSELITMSSLAEAKWANLLNLDVIKKRNKPKAPPQKPKQAPFFIPTVAGLDLQFDVNGANGDNDSSKIHKVKTIENLTSFGKVLKKCAEEHDYSKSLEHFKNLNPSMIDFEIKSLSPYGGGSIELIGNFLDMIVEMLNSNDAFELAQSYLALVLKIHEEIISSNRELIEILDVVEEAQNRSWKKIEEKLFYGIGVVSNLRNFC